MVKDGLTAANDWRNSHLWLKRLNPNFAQSMVVRKNHTAKACVNCIIGVHLKLATRLWRLGLCIEE